MYWKKRLKFLLLVFLIPLLVPAQSNPIIKLEFQAGVGLKSGNFTPCLPSIYVPVYKHIDLGANYNIIKIFYGGGTTQGTGSVVYRFPSFYFRINTSNNMSRLNPFIGYIFSLVKGEHEFRSGNRDRIGYNPYEPMTATEQAILEEALTKTQTAHGAQAGCDVRISNAVSFFLKVTFFSFGESAFPFHYKNNTFSYNNQPYAFGGFIFKFYGKTKKSLIK